MNGDAREHRRGEGVSSYLCSYCCQPWPCPEVERHTYGPAAPTADARADAREQIAQAMFDSDYSGTGFAWDDQAEGPDIGKAYYRRHADAVLAVPAVAEALAAVERCSQLAERWESTHFGRELRRALSGPE